MEAEPPKRKRRWFQFSLRSLLIGVALLAVPCGYVGRQGEIPTRRRNLLSEHHFTFPSEYMPGEPGSIPWIRRAVFGDQAVERLRIRPGVTEEEVEELRSAFPEAKVELEKN